MCGLGIWKQEKWHRCRQQSTLKSQNRLSLNSAILVVLGVILFQDQWFGSHRCKQEHLTAIAKFWTFSISGLRLTINGLILPYSICPKLWAQEPAVETIALKQHECKSRENRCWSCMCVIRKAAQGRVDSTVYELDRKKKTNNNRLVIMTRQIWQFWSCANEGKIKFLA